MYIPGVVEESVHDEFTVELAETSMAVVAQSTVSPVEELIEDDSDTEPAKFSKLVSVMDIAASLDPLLKLTRELVEIVKSPT
jgi:hypothetical protein